MNLTERLFMNTIDPDDVTIDPKRPNHTSPLTWGVYKILEKDCGPAGKRFREGNHPIRHMELMKELGETELVALFHEKGDAVRLAAHLGHEYLGN